MQLHDAPKFPDDDVFKAFKKLIFSREKDVHYACVWGISLSTSVIHTVSAIETKTPYFKYLGAAKFDPA